ncbi:Ubiquitin-associated domain-containing protein 2 [Chionoecetes opilio]|uniref:Ubiquitin-associated domain-containing protein 2 n=1 Tax=Chionoecetes opilio TaxID=41210 RepID=A0A8J5CLQ9_CHIOP|nr:Ubiquitin-associated domain-containing protein 2 [Chionoecetes opilio]
MMLSQALYLTCLPQKGTDKAPVSKGLMGCMFLTCTALNVPLLAHLRKYLICKLPDVFLKGEIWRIASAKISFVDTKDLVCGSLLIYYFRVFERRYGSHKFASFLVASQVITTVLEVLTILTLQWFAIDLHSGGFLPPGPRPTVRTVTSSSLPRTSTSHPRPSFDTLFGPAKWDRFFIVPSDAPHSACTLSFQKCLHRQVGMVTFRTRADWSRLVVVDTEATALLDLKDLDGNPFYITPDITLNTCTGTVSIHPHSCPVDDKEWSDCASPLLDLWAEIYDAVAVYCYTIPPRGCQRYGVIFPLFVNYLFDIPRVAQTSVLGIPITGKTLTYLLGLQVCSTSAATAISAFSGIIAGIFYRYNILYVQQVPWVPGWLARGASATLARLLASPPPPEGPAGATLELQRQEQIESWEQEMMMNRAREMRNRPGANGAVHPFMQNFIGRRQNNPAHPNPPPTEEQVQTLVEMGFDRQRVINALQTCNNDVNTATHLLLQES